MLRVSSRREASVTRSSLLLSVGWDLFVLIVVTLASDREDAQEMYCRIEMSHV